jgi:hypothetical protein
MFKQIIGGGKKNLLFAIPFGVAMDSHDAPTIAQFDDESKPSEFVRKQRGTDVCEKVLQGPPWVGRVRVWPNVSE